MALEHRHHARCACGSALSSYATDRHPQPFVLPGVKRVYERSRPFRITHIALDWEVQFEQRSVVGTATLDLERVDASAHEIVLDAIDFAISDVELRTKSEGFAPTKYIYDGVELRVTIPTSAAKPTLRVRYRVTPRRGLYFMAPDEHVRDRPRQIWSQCQDEDARYIFPCHDKPHNKQTMELRVQVPEAWFALSNGELLSEKASKGNKTYHYRLDEPQASYLFTLVAGEFARIEDSVEVGGGAVPLVYYVPVGRESDGKRTFRRTAEMIRHFGEKTGVPYPWKRYTQIVVRDFIFGGMENTTATTVYEHVLLDERAELDISSDDLIAHELAHQWFGDLVTCRDWSHAWLNEGFATYMEQVDREHHLGRDEYDYGVRFDASAYLGEASGRYQRPIVCQDYDNPIDIFDRHLYEKGACVLHMLRRLLGDEVFWRGVSLYLGRHARGIVETRDLHRALEEASGRSLDQFFEQWVYRAGHPSLGIKISSDGPTTTIDVTQHLPETKGERAAPYGLDLVFDIGIAGGRVVREVRRIDETTHSFSFTLGERPRFVVVDPEQAIIGELKVEAPADLLQRQIAEAPTARGRMLATAGLKRLADPVTIAALAACLTSEGEFWGTRVEAAEALAEIGSDEAFAEVAKHAKTAHPKVRRGVAKALGHFRKSQAVELLKPLALGDVSYLVEAEAARALGSTRQAEAFEILLDTLDRPAWADVIRAGTLDGLAELRDERAVAHVLARTRYGVSTRGRRAAIMALPKLSTDRKVRLAIEDMLSDADPYLRTDVARALSALGDPASREALQRQLDRELDGRVRRRLREVLRDLGGTKSRETERLKNEVEELRHDHVELKARLAKLEALAAAAEQARPGRHAKAGTKEAKRARSSR